MGDKVVLGTDAAASEFCTKSEDKKEFAYDLNKWVKADDDAKENKETLDSAGMNKFYADLVGKYPLESVEDSHDEDDWAGWSAFNKELGIRSNWLETTSWSPIPRESKRRLRKSRVMHCCSRSIRSDPSPRPSRRSKSQSKRDGV